MTAIRALKGDVYLAANRPADAVTAYTEANTANPSSLLTTRLAGALLGRRARRLRGQVAPSRGVTAAA